MSDLSRTVRWQEEDGIAVLTVTNPPVNALSASVREGLVKGLDRAKSNSAIKGVVICCDGASFFSGADITEFGAAEVEPTSQRLIDVLDAMEKPIAAAIHVRALGGGLEIALACHSRVATVDTVFGFPEVKLGIIPGLGGTQRFPRLVGYEKALDLIVSGETIDCAQAHKLGLVDEISSSDLVGSAVNHVRQLAKGGNLRRTRDYDYFRMAAKETAEIFEIARERARRIWPGHKAPEKAIEAVAFGVEASFDDAIVNEARIFDECVMSEESRALMGLFFAERQTRFVAGLDKTIKATPLSRIGILGAGSMGRGIAIASLDAGYEVCLVDQNIAVIENSRSLISKNYARAVERGRLSGEASGRRLQSLVTSSNTSELADCDLVIEAVYEDITLKKSIFSMLDAICRPGCIIASNTSGLNLDEIASQTSRPGDVIGLHFFNPANIMKLVEVVRGADSEPTSIATGVEYVRSLTKFPIVSGVCPGFIANRIFDHYFRQAEFLVEEGADPYAIDAALEEWGMAMGPFAVTDLTGLDVSNAIRKTYPAGHPSGTSFPAAEDELFKAGRLGQKSGAGWYRYQGGSFKREPDPEVAEILSNYRQQSSFISRQITTEEIVSRCMLALVNEAANVLLEGIAGRASDIDIASVYGYGFPRRRGGPIFQADLHGTASTLADVERLHERLGYWWKPSPLLKQLGATNTPFSEYRTSTSKTGA